jgi:predicted enzyme related to lactoylglutathione lyase
MKMLVNLLCTDVQSQMLFYEAVFGFTEIPASRSPIYRVLDTGGSELGFNAPDARALLNLPARAPMLPADTLHATTVFATFMVDQPEAVDVAARRTLAHGGRIVKAAFRTYYQQWQSVLADPEGHVFRVSCLVLPAELGAAVTSQTEIRRT